MTSHPGWPSHGLYAITAGSGHAMRQKAKLVLEGGAAVLQYRDAGSDAARRRDDARALGQLCKAHQVPFLIGHDLALAHEVGADGVHLAGNEDIAAARNALGRNAIIGMSCGDSLQRAKDAITAGATYVSFGAFFPSLSKPDAAVAPLDLLRQSAALGMPRVAIGGITPDNAGLVAETGVEFIAAIAALFDATDARATARRFAQLFPPFSGQTP